MPQNQGGGAYRVVLNREEQYSIWPTEWPKPDGWSDEGTHGTRDECLARIQEVWTDVRPLSLRQHLAAKASAARTGS